jgi:hypothetical protein
LTLALAQLEARSNVTRQWKCELQKLILCQAETTGYDRKHSGYGYPSALNNQHREMGQHFKYSCIIIIIIIIIILFYFFSDSAAQRGLWPPRIARFRGHKQRRATVGRTHLDECSARRRDLYLTTHTTDKHPCPRWDSKPRSQEASGRRPTPYTARPLGPGSTAVLQS